MSNWNQKSVKNLNAATYLLKNDFCNESVHCSYYSCVQYAFHIMYSFWDMGVDEIDTQSQTSYNQVGTHKWLKNEIFKSLHQQNKESASLFNTKMSELSKLRVKADYKFNFVNDTKAQEANIEAIAIIDLLKKIYEV